MATRTPALLLVLALAAACARGEDASPCTLMDGIENWEARVFAGAPEIRGFVQGAKNECAVSGIMAFDSRGNAYVTGDHVIQIITPDGQARVLTGAPNLGGNSDGPPGQATFGLAIDLVLIDDALIYVVDAANLTLRRLTCREGVWHTETVAGTPGVNGHRDGPGRQALFTTPFDSITADETGAVYLLDGNWLRKFDKGVVTTLNAGSGYRNGPLAQALFQRSQGRQHGMTYDGKGNLYIADKLNMCIRKVDLKSREVSTLAGVLPGQPHAMPRDGPALEARFHSGGGPNMIFYNQAMDALIARSDDENSIRIIKDGWVKTFGPAPGKGKGLTGPWKDAIGGVPCGIDREGGVYVMGAQCIRLVLNTKRGLP